MEGGANTQWGGTSPLGAVAAAHTRPKSHSATHPALDTAKRVWGRSLIQEMHKILLLLLEMPVVPALLAQGSLHVMRGSEWCVEKTAMPPPLGVTHGKEGG